MFEGWTFLLGEIWVLLALAGLLGLGAGWLIWHQSPDPVAAVPDPAALKAARDKGRAEAMDKLKAASAKLERAATDASRRDARLKGLEAEVDSLRGELAFNPPPRVETADHKDNQTDGAPDQELNGDGRDETSEDGGKPAVLTAPRGGQADDLTKINGIGPKLQDLCHALGVYHLDQIAGWSGAEVAWMDANLAGFNGRVTRDDWVAQAQALTRDTP